MLTPHGRRLKAEGKYCDFTVQCGEAAFLVHRLVLLSRSEYFEKACGGSFKASIVRYIIVWGKGLMIGGLHQEADQAVIRLHDDDVENVQRMLDFIYGQASDTSLNVILRGWSTDPF